jgi:hypothetical protein
MGCLCVCLLLGWSFLIDGRKGNHFLGKGEIVGRKIGTVFQMSHGPEKFSRKFFVTVGLFFSDCGTFGRNFLENFSSP